MARNGHRGSGRETCPFGGIAVLAVQLSVEQHLRDLGLKVLSVQLNVEAEIFQN